MKAVHRMLAPLLVVTMTACGDSSTTSEAPTPLTEQASPTEAATTAEDEGVPAEGDEEAPEEPTTEEEAAAADPPPFRFGTFALLAGRDDPSFDNEAVARLAMFAGEAVQRPSGRVEFWKHEHVGAWGLVPMEDPPLEYEEVTLVTANHTLCRAPVVRAQQFWGRLDDYSGTIQNATFLALTVDPESECTGHDAFVGAPVHEISLQHSDLRRARQSLVREVTPYDYPSFDYPTDFDGTLRAIHLPRYDVVVISGEHLFVKRGDKLYSAEGYTRLWEADGHGLFFFADHPADPGVVTLDQAFDLEREPLGPEDIEYCEQTRAEAVAYEATQERRAAEVEALTPRSGRPPAPTPGHPNRVDPWAGTPPDQRPIGGG